MARPWGRLSSEIRQTLQLAIAALALCVVVVVLLAVSACGVPPVSDATAARGWAAAGTVLDPAKPTITVTLWFPSFLARAVGVANPPMADPSVPVFVRRLPAGSAAPGSPLASGYAATDRGDAARLVLEAPEGGTSGDVPLTARLRAAAIPGAGKFEGGVTLLDTAVDKSRAYSAVVRAQDLILWPLLAVFTGAALAWIWLVRYRDVVRPRTALRHTLLTAAEAYAAARRDVPPLKRPFDLGHVFHQDDFSPDDSWACENVSASSPWALRTWCELENADGEKIATLQKDVADIAQLTRLWPDACAAAGQLRKRLDDLQQTVLTHDGALPPALRDGNRIRPSVYDETTRHLPPVLASPPASLTAMTDYISRVKQQAAATRRWLELWQIYTARSRLYEALHTVRDKMSPADQQLLDLAEPTALFKTILLDAGTQEELARPERVETLRQWERTLLALGREYQDSLPPADRPAVSHASPAGAVTSLARKRPLDVISRLDWTIEDVWGTNLFPNWLSAFTEAGMRSTDAERESDVPRYASGPTSAGLLHEIRAHDWAEFWITLLVTVLLYLLSTYVDKDFGSGWQYLAAFLAGIGGQVVVNWRLLPWSRPIATMPSPAGK